MARFTFESGAYASDPASPGIFGANVLMGRDDLNGTFHTKSAGWGLSVLRFPGGAITEDYFDVTAPDSPVAGLAAGHMGLSDFLAYCATYGHRPAIVLPTKRYLADPATGEAEIRTFVEAVMRGDYGPASDPIFQIGNEFYAASSFHAAISADAYGEIAARFAVAVDQAAGQPVTVIVQKGRKVADNAVILSAFDTPQEIGAVDGVSYHQYPWRLEVVEGRFQKAQILVGEWQAAGAGTDIFLSEWNLGSSSNASTDPFHDYGQPQNGVLKEVIYQSILAGIDYGAIWGIQQNNKTSLSANEGDSTVYSAGEMFALMAQSLPGSQALGRSQSADGSVLTYAYEGAHEATVFVVALDLDLAGGPVTVDVGLAGAGYRPVSAVSLTTNDPVAEPRPQAVITNYTPQMILSDGAAHARLALSQDYEVVRLQFEKPIIGEALAGGLSADVLVGGEGADTIRGHDGADAIAAFGGADLLRGGRRADELLGGAGQDTLNGGASHDSLNGGTDGDWLEGNSGSDTLMGGAGDDRLIGGVGRDFLYGGTGSDRLDGGLGNDRYWGGQGVDHFVFSQAPAVERILDFELGTDVIDLTALSGVNSALDLGFGPQQGALDIYVMGGVIRLRHVDETQIEAIDFWF